MVVEPGDAAAGVRRRGRLVEPSDRRAQDPRSLNGGYQGFVVAVIGVFVVVVDGVFSEPTDTRFAVLVREYPTGEGP